MGALKLCTYKKAEYPLYLEMLSLHVYTMEELCYAMESSLFLLDESWMGTEFFQWIAEGVGNAELAGHDCISGIGMCMNVLHFCFQHLGSIPGRNKKNWNGSLKK